MGDDEIFVQGGEAFMADAGGFSVGSRRNEDIALDMMKFIALTTGYGKTAASGGPGFQSAATAPRADEYANNLLELYARCLDAVNGKRG